MVGVTGKYKGCENFRRRRIKCSNERLSCSNCVNGGRQCQGYEREHVFITGTPATKGRVASHPRRRCPTKKQRATPSANVEAQREPTPQLVTTGPLSSAWEDSESVPGGDTSALLMALQTSLHNVSAQASGDAPGSSLHIVISSHTPPELPKRFANEEFSPKSRCLIQLEGERNIDGVAYGFCVFLFEPKLPVVASNSMNGQWEAFAEQAGLVARQAPEDFKTFPHHYFLRIYRPLAINSSLISRRKSCLSEQSWIMTPWEVHPKSALDQLLDIVLHLLPILVMADELPFQISTISKRLKAQQLLENCLSVDMQLCEWHQNVIDGAESQQAPFWCEEQPEGDIPFFNLYTFRDNLTALMMLYYWMVKISFHRCIVDLHGAICEMVVDAYPNACPDLPPSLPIDPAHYHDGREFANKIFHGLDFSLQNTTQPDLLLAPVLVALGCYRDIQATWQDAAWEILWLEDFHRRLISKGQYMATILSRHQWVELARY